MHESIKNGVDEGRGARVVITDSGPLAVKNIVYSGGLPKWLSLHLASSDFREEPTRQSRKWVFKFALLLFENTDNLTKVRS